MKSVRLTHDFFCLAATLLRFWTERKRIEKLRYMHRNPVARGWVQEPEQWPWAAIGAMLSGKRARCESISGVRPK